MSIVLNLISALIKSLHLLFESREAWYLIVFNRNLIILLLTFSFFIPIKFIYGRFKFFTNVNFKKEKQKLYFLHLTKYIKKLYILSRFAVEFWLLSFIMCELDTYLCYYRIRKTDFLLLTELIPTIFILIRILIYLYTGETFIKWIKQNIAKPIALLKNYLFVLQKK